MPDKQIAIYGGIYGRHIHFHEPVILYLVDIRCVPCTIVLFPRKPENIQF